MSAANETTTTDRASSAAKSGGGLTLSSSALLAAQVQIPLYSVIFLLAVLGNSLVITTLLQNKRMRTVTNVHLLNLAISDLLLGLFCMPFTLVGSILKDFIFGSAMCKLIPYLQAVSVSVSAWTLVAISVERYYAICHPLMSLRWQTLSHAHRIAAATWIGSLVCMAPIAALSFLQPLGQTGRSKCREEWPNDASEKAYNIFLDAILLVVPLLIMVITYSRITATLWRGIRTEEMSRDSDETREVLSGIVVERRDTVNEEVPCYKVGGGGRVNSGTSPSSSEETLTPVVIRTVGSVGRESNATNMTAMAAAAAASQNSQPSVASTTNRHRSQTTVPVRRTNVEVSLTNKKRVIKMLFVVVLEFFVCWTPLYVVNTLALFRPRIVYDDLGYTAISLFQLMAYASSCCNPITYCFMNSKFKRAFLLAFGCTTNSISHPWFAIRASTATAVASGKEGGVSSVNPATAASNVMHMDTFNSK